METKRIITWYTTADPTVHTSYFKAETSIYEVAASLAARANVSTHDIIVDTVEPVTLQEYHVSDAAQAWLHERAGAHSSTPTTRVLFALLGVSTITEVERWAESVAGEDQVIIETPF